MLLADTIGQLVNQTSFQFRGTVLETRSPVPSDTV